MPTKSVTDASFKADVLSEDQAVLVDFWAGHCTPCHQIAPTLEEISNDYEGRLTVAKVNIDDNPEMPDKYGIRSIPTLMIFQDGAVTAMRIGAGTKRELTAWIDETLRETSTTSASS